MTTSQENHKRYKSKLVEITCALIDEQNGYANINMRTVARKAGCAHTNIYNYFDNYVELLYAAKLKTMEKLVVFTQQHVGTKAETYEHFSAFINAQIEFAIQHQGLYRFFWLEELPGAVPLNIMMFAKELRNRFATLVFNCSKNQLSYEDATIISDILHSYLHGEICKVISKRNIHLPFDQDKERINSNVNKLMLLLFENHQSFLNEY